MKEVRTTGDGEQRIHLVLLRRRCGDDAKPVAMHSFERSRVLGKARRPGRYFSLKVSPRRLLMRLPSRESFSSPATSGNTLQEILDRLMRRQKLSLAGLKSLSAHLACTRTNDPEVIRRA
jgi:hypothetical protein